MSQSPRRVREWMVWNPFPADISYIFSSNARINTILMKTSAREDLLEALCILSRDSPDPPTIATLSGHLSRPEEEVRDYLHAMQNQGDLHILPGDRVEITPQGSKIGTQVMKKHKVLECFLSDILGMDRGAASEEACILEHNLSDEALERLDRYIAHPGKRWRRRKFDRPHIATLLDFPEGTELNVVSMKCPGGCQRLLDMGILPGEKIRLVHTLDNKAMVIHVKGYDIAISPEIASCIFVEHAE